MILTRVGYKFDFNKSWGRNCGTPIIEESTVYEKMCKYLLYYNINKPRLSLSPIEMALKSQLKGQEVIGL